MRSLTWNWRRSLGLRVLAAALFVVPAACRGAEPGGVSTGPARHLRVLAIHDLHGGLRPAAHAWSNGRPVGGVARMKTVMDGLEAACACPTVRVDGGDQMQGTLESNLTLGASTVAALNQLGLDAAAVGNHELDWGVETLLARQGEARYAWLAANVFRIDSGQRAEWATPFAMVERAGVTLGVIGYATASTPRTLRRETGEPYEFRSGYAAIRDAVDAVWRRRPDFVVVLAHAGGECGAGGCAGEMVELAAEVPPGRVHLIAGGHDHTPGEGVVNSIPIVRAGSSGRAVSVVDLYRRDDGIHAFRVARQPVSADDVQDDAAMASLVAPALRAADDKGQERVTTLAEPLTASSRGDRRLGAFIAEAVRLFAGADVGLQNPGGVRADLPRGAISYADLYRVVPFGNTVVRLTISGRQLRQLVEQAGPSFYYSNLRIESGAPVLPRLGSASLRFSDGTPIRDDGVYSLATADFLADGGDGLTLLSTLARDPLGDTVLDAVIAQLRKLPAPVVLARENRQ